MRKDNIIKRIGKKIISIFNMIIFYIRIPKEIKKKDWNKMDSLIIGGYINPIFEKKFSNSKKTIRVDISKSYINSKNIIDIQADAHSLKMLKNESMDFLASSHTIEHLTNLLKALKEWNRILKKGGIIYACVPYYKKTFDHKRKLTPIEHIDDDYKNNVGLDDKTHNEEFISNFDINKDICFSNHDIWYKNYMTNPQIYTHYHVFDKKNLSEIMLIAGFKTISVFYNGISIEYFGIKI